ncbi:MAG: hypothetical protein H8E55_72315 [Pelagibacterales bacterium]|nr:hypothetical protein [Pelagibacterales bacterium]
MMDFILFIVAGGNMGKIKRLLEEDMMLNPDLYDEDFWIKCRYEELLENQHFIIKKPTKKEIHKNEKISTR